MYKSVHSSIYTSIHIPIHIHIYSDCCFLSKECHLFNCLMHDHVQPWRDICTWRSRQSVLVLHTYRPLSFHSYNPMTSTARWLAAVSTAGFLELPDVFILRVKEPEFFQPYHLLQALPRDVTIFYSRYPFPIHLLRALPREYTGTVYTNIHTYIYPSIH